MDPRHNWVVPLAAAAEYPDDLIGGKAAKLVRARSAGLVVPGGFCVTTRAYEEFLAGAGLAKYVAMELGRKPLDSMRWEEIWDTALRIRSEFLRAEIPEAVSAEIRRAVGDIPGVVVSVEQPISHLISHMLSGVKAQVGIKLYGENLDSLRRKAHEMRALIADVEGVKDLQVEQQTLIPQLRIEVDREKLKNYGLRPGDINEFVETAMQGKVVSEVLVDQRFFDLLIRMDEPFREDLNAVRRLSIALPDGGSAKLESVADIYNAAGPSTIKRERVRRRIVLQCNTAGRGLVDVVEEIKERLAKVDLPKGYFLEYGGQFES